MDPSIYNSNLVMPNICSPSSSETFTRHTDSVLCCSIDDKARLAVSGGIDDTAFVWNLSTKHVLFECKGHQESVVAAAFSLGSTYVATGDLNGHIQVRNTVTGIKISEYDIDEVNWLLWHNTSEFVLLAGTTKGDFWMWNVNDPAAIKTFPSYGSATTIAKLPADGMRIVTAYGNGSIRLFNLKTREIISQMSDASDNEIICIDLNPKKALIAAGYMNSTVKLITLNECKVIGTMTCKSPSKPASTGDNSTSEVQRGESEELEANNSQSGDDNDTIVGEAANADNFEVIDEYSNSAATGNEASPTEDDEELYDDDDDEAQQDCIEDGDPVESVESVVFSPCGNFLAAANNSGSIYIWDVSTTIARCELHTGVGITRCAWTDKGNLVTGCLNGMVKIYNVNLELVKEMASHSDQILDIAYRDGILVTASEDKTCRATEISN